jgi:ABC-type multidrug transport system ATPase subunit
MELEIQTVSKKYGKDKFGLKDFSLSMDKGILGLLGPNGAGKSTLLRLVATIGKPTSGAIILNKNNIVKDPNYMRKQLGYLPQDFGVYPNLNAIEFLAYIAAMKGIGGHQLKSKINGLLEGLNLAHAAQRPIGTYSGGMKQRVGIAQALLNDPKIVIFDEPTVGLDPEERVRFRNLITDLANDCIVILSSHIVSDIDTIADKVAIMKDGTLRAHGSQEQLISKVKGSVFETTMNKATLRSFRENNLVVSTARQADDLKVRFISKTSVPGAIKKEANLEDAYLFTTKMNSTQFV